MSGNEVVKEWTFQLKIHQYILSSFADEQVLISVGDARYIKLKLEELYNAALEWNAS